MTTRPLSIEEQRRLVRIWGEAGAAMERLRRQELASLSPQEAREATYDLLQLGGMLPLPPARQRSSGLVEMQRVFVRGHGRRGR
ncbi:MAG: hypothetical protein ACT4P4_16415 [Betaproteobacteria bacterium]